MPATLKNANAYYVEEIPAMDWEIHTDTLTVTTYLCQKAVCRFRGRDYIAWFTPDIPINNGPWKFGGLPGLILKISDGAGRCDFECIEIIQSNPNFPIKKHREYDRYQKKDRKVILKLQTEIQEDYRQVAGLIPVWGSKRPPKRTYESIELE